MTDFRKYLLCALLAVIPVAAAAESVFSERLRDMYHLAFDTNSAGDYSNAYRMIVSADERMSAEMAAASVVPQQLDDWDFIVVYFPVRISLAEIAYKLGLFSVMEQVSADLSALVEKRGGDDSMRARIAKVDAGVHYLKGEYYDAAQDLLKSMHLFSYDSKLTRSLRIELAQLFYALEDYEEALLQLEEALEIEESADVLSHKALCLARMGDFDEALKLMEPLYRKDDAEWHRRKAKILMLEYEATGVYNPEAKRLYADYLSIARRYVDAEFVSLTSSEREQYWQGEKSFVTDCYRLEDKAPELLYDVALFSKAVLLQLGRVFSPDMTEKEKEKALSAVRIDWKTVKKKMPDGSAAVEFITYDKGGTDYLGAVVINKTLASPVFVPIAPVSAIEYRCWEEGMYASSLPYLLWSEEMMENLEGCDDIYFAADGILHQIPVEFIVPDGMEGKNIYRLTSTRMLVEPRKPFSNSNMLLVGGIDYDYGRSESDVSNDAQAYSIFAGTGLSLGYLSGSRTEVESIAGARRNSNDSLMLGMYAGESEVRNLMNRYGIVHIATHGYFADDLQYESDFIPMTSDLQLSRNCLFLSGVQRNLEDIRFDPSMPDGILSARELAGMNLENVSLVSLSACQSGLGYVTVDGVFGLQRGLKAAGAGAMVVSLWNVDDDAAVVFFQRFYANIDSGMPVHQAFMDAREYLRTAEVVVKRRRAGLHSISVRKRFDNETYYNAFILIDGF